jgi:hypothetical protein
VPQGSSGLSRGASAGSPFPHDRRPKRPSARPGVPVEGRPLGRQGIDHRCRLSPELLGFDADAPLAVVLAVPVLEGCHGRLLAPSTPADWQGHRAPELLHDVRRHEPGQDLLGDELGHSARLWVGCGDGADHCQNDGSTVVVKCWPSEEQVTPSSS